MNHSKVNHWWDESEDALLTRLWDAGVLVPEIVKLVNRSYFAVTSRVRRLNLTPRSAPLKPAAERRAHGRALRLPYIPLPDLSA